MNNYKNSIKFNVRTDQGEVVRKDIVLGLKELLTVDELKLIDIIMSVGNNQKWFVSFKETNIANKLFGKKIKIGKQYAFINDPSDESIVKTFRVFWMVPETPRNLIEANLNSYGKVLDIFDEYMKEEGLEYIKTGVVRFKVKFTREQIKKLNEMVGVKFLKGKKILVTVAGEKIGCFLCECKDHMKKVQN